MIQHNPTSRDVILAAGHICLDVIPDLLASAPLRPGHLTIAGPARLSTGGAVANVGVALHRLGMPVRLVARVGDDAFGGVVLDSLRAVHPGLERGVRVVPGQATSYSIVLNPPGVDRAFLHCPGVNDTFTASDIPTAELAAARIVHLGYPPLMRRLYADGGVELAHAFETAHAAGVATSLDLCDVDPDGPAAAADWVEVLARTLPHVDLFAPSVDELRTMLGCVEAPTDRAMVATLAERALALGARIVAIKLGDQGLYLRTHDDLDGVRNSLGLDPDSWRNREVLSPCFTPTRLAGTTGSGDATVAGLLSALLRGADPVTAATAATAVGACSVEAPDATSGIRAWSEVQARLDGGWARSPVDAALIGGLDWQRDSHGTLFDPLEAS